MFNFIGFLFVLKKGVFLTKINYKYSKVNFKTVIHNFFFEL